AAVGCRQAKRALEHLGLDVLREGGKERALTRVRGPTVRRQLRALEEALRALVDPVEQAAVDPFGIEQEDEGASDAIILKDGSTGVEDERGHAGGQARVELTRDDPAGRRREGFVALDPAARLVLGPHGDLAGLEGLAQGGGITEVFEADLV